MTPTTICSFCLDRALRPPGALLDLALEEPRLDRLERAAHRVDLPDESAGAVHESRRQRLDGPRAAERVDDARDPGFVGDDLLGPEREKRGRLGGERERLVLAVRVERLRPAEDRRERLDGDADDVHVGLLGRERRARRLGVKAHRRGRAGP